MFANKTQLAKIGLIFTTLAWGATFVITDEALKDAPPFTFNAFRFLIAFISTFFFVRGKILNLTKLEFWGAFVCGLFLFLGYAFQNFGLWDHPMYISSTPSKSAFITSISVILVPIFLIIHGKQKISNKIWLSVILAIFGLFMLLNPLQEGFSGGDFITLGCAIFFAYHIIFQGNYVKKNINISRFFLIQVGIVSLLSFLFKIFFESHQSVVWSQTLISAIMINGIICTTIAIMIMVWAQKIISQSQTAIFFSLEPVFAALFSWLLIGEILGLYGWIGGFIVVVAIIISDA